MIYIVVKDEGDYDSREIYNEAVFDAEWKAIEYIKRKGYVYNEGYREYEKQEKDGYPKSYRIEEWNLNTFIIDKN